MVLCLLLTGSLTHLLRFFGFSCYIIRQRGMYFSRFLILHFIIVFLLKFYKAISIKWRFPEIHPVLISLAHWRFYHSTSKLITDINNRQRDKRERIIFQRLEGPHDFSSKISSSNFRRNLYFKIQNSSLKFMKFLNLQAHVNIN